MAIIWESIIDGSHYQVRTAGASVRLYRNGVNHSQINPKRPLSGSIWDLITLPTLHRLLGSINNVCILGFGAGSVGRQLMDLNVTRHIVGIELDPIHLSIAKGFFECDKGYELIANDAVEWVYGVSNNALYDVIIDDLYTELDNVPVRSVPMDEQWFVELGKLLKPSGMLIFNIIEHDKIPNLPIFKSTELRKLFSEVIMYRIDGYENRVIAFSKTPFNQTYLNFNLNKILEAYPACRGVQNKYIRCSDSKIKLDK